MILAVVLVLFLGALGIHNFYLGYINYHHLRTLTCAKRWGFPGGYWIKKGVAQLILSLVGWATTFIVIGYLPLAIVYIWIFIEFIQLLILSKKAQMSLASGMNLTTYRVSCNVKCVGNLSLPTERRNVKRVEIL